MTRAAKRTSADAARRSVAGKRGTALAKHGLGAKRAGAGVARTGEAKLVGDRATRAGVARTGEAKLAGDRATRAGVARTGEAKLMGDRATRAGETRGRGADAAHADATRADATRAGGEVRRVGSDAGHVNADAVFRALGDPTRRALLDHLRVGERVVTELCAPFDMSQPAISQHLKVLADAGLVVATRRGRERVYQLCAAPLRAAFDWLAHYEAFWSQGLDRLAAFLDAEDAAAAGPPPRARAARGST